MQTDPRKRSGVGSRTLCLTLSCQFPDGTSTPQDAPVLRQHGFRGMCGHPQHFTQVLLFVQQMTLSAEQSPQPHLPIFKQRKEARTEKGDSERQQGAMGRDPMTGKLKLSWKVLMKEVNEKKEEVCCV